MYKITAVQNKNNDWKVVSILNAAGDIVENVSVNRINKKGEVFPDFDNIQVGASIEGQMWQSPKGAMYLFAPKNSAKRVDQGPASRNPETAELKNILNLKIIPMLDAIHKELIVINERAGLSKDDFEMPAF